MTSKAFNAWAASRKRAVDERLTGALPQPRTGRLAAAMRYAVASGGKRLRPLMCINAAESLGGSMRHALPCACALELVHCYSLVHDDLPAMDDDCMRRGKPSCHAKYGEATALLAGTSLLTLAFGMLADAGRRPVRVLADAAGHAGMNGGQMLDLAMTGKGRRILRQRILEIHRLKTAALFGAAMQLGALAAAAPPATVRLMGRLGSAAGQLYQIVDDLIDESPAPDTGKTPHKDRAQGKPSIVVSQGISRAAGLAREAHGKILRAMRRSGIDHRHLPAILETMLAPLVAAGLWPSGA